LDKDIIETERLILKPTTVNDAKFILELVNTPKWLKYIGDRKIYTINESEKYIREKILPQYKKLGFSNYTLINKIDNVKIGSCGLYDRSALDGVDIGFAILPNYERQGYIHEAAKKIIEVGFNNFKLNKILAITIKENIASQNLLMKLGLEFIKIFQIPDDNEELMLYRIENLSKTNGYSE